MTELERVRAQLRQLGLRTMADAFEAEAELAVKSQSSFVAYLGRLADLEAASKTDRSIRARLGRAHFPAFCTIEAFDFSFQPSLNAAAVRELATLGFLQKAVNLVWVGPPGTGKSHLAISVGIKACEAHKSVLFVKAADLVDQLLAASVNRTLGRLLQTLTRLDLLVIDEVGYLPMSEPSKANLFFQLVSRAYENMSLAITTNRPFQEWDQVFGDPVIAAAILDRLLHHSIVFAINGPSYRLKDKLERRSLEGGDRPGVTGFGHEGC